MQDKIIELETKFSFQEQLLSDLNDVVVRQQHQIDGILRELSVIKAQLKEALEQDSNPAAEDLDQQIPPHY